MRLSLVRGAGARPSAARHCGGAQSKAAPSSAPLLPRARAGAQHDAVPHLYGTLGLSDTVHDEDGEPSCGAHAAHWMGLMLAPLTRRTVGWDTLLTLENPS